MGRRDDRGIPVAEREMVQRIASLRAFYVDLRESDAPVFPYPMGVKVRGDGARVCQLAFGQHDEMLHGMGVRHQHEPARCRALHEYFGCPHFFALSLSSTEERLRDYRRITIFLVFVSLPLTRLR